MRQIVLEFIDAINKHDVVRICKMMAEDHVFIDAQGSRFSGKEKMKDGWKGYFEIFPDYKIDISQLFEDGNSHALFGYASGSYKGSKEEDPDCYWKLPAAWRAVVEDGKIKHWQVYADTKIPFEIINRSSKL
jgi:ketosteroid isomerase-like protein